MTKKIKMGEDSKVWLTKIDEDGNVQDRVWAHIVETDAIIGNQTSKEGMNQNTKGTEKIIHKHDQFIGMVCWEILTGRWMPACSRPVGKDAVHHQAVERHFTTSRPHPLLVTADLVIHLL